MPPAGGSRSRDYVELLGAQANVSRDIGPGKDGRMVARIAHFEHDGVLVDAVRVPHLYADGGRIIAEVRKPGPKQHYAAWWELYLRFTRLGFVATPHAKLPDGKSRPDLLVERSTDFLLCRGGDR